ncbi:hypothetical protein V8C40DRAFT_240797 [Trichoderma camerunense]
MAFDRQTKVSIIFVHSSMCLALTCRQMTCSPFNSLQLARLPSRHQSPLPCQIVTCHSHFLHLRDTRGPISMTM